MKLFHIKKLKIKKFAPPSFTHIPLFNHQHIPLLNTAFTYCSCSLHTQIQTRLQIITYDMRNYVRDLNFRSFVYTMRRYYECCVEWNGWVVWKGECWVTTWLVIIRLLYNMCKCRGTSNMLVMSRILLTVFAHSGFLFFFLFLLSFAHCQLHTVFLNFPLTHKCQ